MLYDKDIREPLFEFLEERHNRIRILEEIVIGKTRVDVIAVLANALCGIEIKSDADTYARLARQVKDYNRVFDYNIVVVGEKHGLSAPEHVPDYWGIITVGKDELTGEVDFYILREPKPNPKREKAVKLRNQMSLLWRPEIAHIQELNGMHKYAAMSKINVIKKVMEVVPEETLKVQISDELIERDYSTIAERINEYKKAKGTDKETLAKKKAEAKAKSKKVKNTETKTKSKSTSKNEKN